MLPYVSAHDLSLRLAGGSIGIELPNMTLQQDLKMAQKLALQAHKKLVQKLLQTPGVQRSWQSMRMDEVRRTLLCQQLVEQLLQEWPRQRQLPHLLQHWRQLEELKLMEHLSFQKLLDVLRFVVLLQKLPVTEVKLLAKVWLQAQLERLVQVALPARFSSVLPCHHCQLPCFPARRLPLCLAMPYLPASWTSPMNAFWNPDVSTNLTMQVVCILFDDVTMS